MRWITCFILIALPWLPVMADFDSASDGSYGPILVDDSTGNMTLDLPPDGIFHATTITVTDAKTLSFNPNALNTPVYLLATGDINIGLNDNNNERGHISVRGQDGTSTAGGFGGPGGFNGGSKGRNGEPGGAGYGPGSGLGTLETVGGDAGHALKGGNNELDGDIYGSQLLVPILGGSGGGGTPNRGGNGGGGAIVLASNTLIDISYSNSYIDAEGSDSGNQGAGSGGAIRLIAPIVRGNGYLNVTGGGAGRVRIDTIDRSNLALRISPSNGLMTTSSFMQVFPTTIPRLDIIAAAGQNIPEGTSSQQSILLATGSPSSQPFTVQARDFVGLVPITIAITPESGDPIKVDTEINMANANPATVTVNIDLPANIPLHIHAWTR